MKYPAVTNISVKKQQRLKIFPFFLFTPLLLPSVVLVLIKSLLSTINHQAPKSLINAQGPEEMCLSLEHQNPLKTSEKMGYFDRVTVSLHIL